MGYTTYFGGEFNLDKPLTEEHNAYLTKFAESRRMKREPYFVETLPDPIRESVSLPIGYQGEYFVGGQDFCGQREDHSVVDYNDPPENQPGLWCQWVPTEDGTQIVWDDGEKFYDYVEWIEYLIEHFLKPWGYVLSGEVSWEGEESSDIGVIYVKDNQVEAVESVITNPFPSFY